MVNIVHHGPNTASPDEDALEFFIRQWTVYRKVVIRNYVFHHEVCEILHRFLLDDVAPSFWFLDIACGDSSMTYRALKGTPVAHYHGIDLVEPALEIAAKNLDGLDCEKVLEQADFIQAMRDRPEPADVVWMGLALHHLETADKLMLLREIHAVLGASGVLLMYEPTIPDSEVIRTFHQREEAIVRETWTALTPEELKAVVDHVWNTDIPETSSDLIDLGRQAGFEGAWELYVSPTNIYRMYCFRV